MELTFDPLDSFSLRMTESGEVQIVQLRSATRYYYIPWEPTTFIFKGYNPYIGG